MSATDEEFMRLALAQAAEAARQEEVPVGAVIVGNGEVVGTGFNQRESRQNPLAMPRSPPLTRRPNVCAIGG